MPVGSYTAQHGSNVTHFPKVATDEGELSPHDYYEVSLPLVGLALGDGHIFYRLKDASRFLGAFLSLNDTGSSSGSTDVMLHNATDSADLLSAALSVAYDAATPYDEDESPVSAEQELEADELVRVDVDAVPGGGTPQGVLVLRFQALNPTS